MGRTGGCVPGGGGGVRSVRVSVRGGAVPR